jgi:PAS domain S-box-containing protein
MSFAMAKELNGLCEHLLYGVSTIAKIVFRQSDLSIVAANKRAELLYGYSQSELESLSILELSSDPPSTQRVIDRLASISDSLFHSETPLRRTHRRKDGSEFVAQVGFDRCCFEDQTYMCKYVQDASGVLHTEKLLDESTERFRAVADYTYDWESWIDWDGKLIWVNPAVERLTGFSVQECLQMIDYPIQMVDPQDRPMLEQIMQGAIAGNSGNDIEFRVVTKDASLKWFAVSWQPLIEPVLGALSTKPSSFRMSMRDIADRKQMEQALREHSLHLEELASRRALTIVELEKKKIHTQKLAAMGEMAASIAHEINNPLAGVKNAIKLVGEESTLGSPSRELLVCVNKEIDRIAKLVQQFHQLCRPSLGVPVRVDLHQLALQVLGWVQAQCPNKSIQVQWIGWPEAFDCDVHEPELRQILHNLILNAFEASLDGETIQLVFERESHCELLLKIVDRGNGIDPDQLSHVFEPFFTTKFDSRQPGTGLGLSVSRSLAIALGGTIEVESQLGQGSTFLLRLKISESLDPPNRNPGPMESS